MYPNYTGLVNQKQSTFDFNRNVDLKVGHCYLGYIPRNN